MKVYTNGTEIELVLSHWLQKGTKQHERSATLKDRQEQVSNHGCLGAS